MRRLGIQVNQGDAVLDGAGGDQADGHGRQADIWSVACTVIEMATGKPPWSQYGSSVGALTVAHRDQAQQGCLCASLEVGCCTALRDGCTDCAMFIMKGSNATCTDA